MCHSREGANPAVLLHRIEHGTGFPLARERRNVFSAAAPSATGATPSRPRYPVGVKRRIPHQPGAEHEPHLSSRPIVPDDSNCRDEEPVRASSVDPQPAEFSASDEPALGWAKLDRSKIPGFAEDMLDRTARTTVWHRVGVAVGVLLLAGPFAIGGAFFEGFFGPGTGWGALVLVIVGPVTEEMLKIGLILYLAERRPWLLLGAASILALGAGGGLAFGAMENLVYLKVYFPGAGPELSVWRWSITMPMHVICSTIAAGGVVRMWRFVRREHRPAPTSLAFPWLVTAMVIHGGYNAVALILSMTGIDPV